MKFNISVSNRHYEVPDDFVFPEMKLYGKILIKSTLSGQGEYVFKGSSVILLTGELTHIDVGLAKLYGHFSKRLQGHNLSQISAAINGKIIINGINPEADHVTVRFGGRTKLFKPGQEGKLLRYLDAIAAPKEEQKLNKAKVKKRLKDLKAVDKRKAEYKKMLTHITRSGWRPIESKINTSKEFETYVSSFHDSDLKVFIFLFPDTLMWEASQFERRYSTGAFLLCKGQGESSLDQYLYGILDRKEIICDKKRYAKSIKKK